MNWQHLQTIFWLRWRLRANQLNRAGLGNSVLLAVLAGIVVLLAVGIFIAALLLGLLALRDASAVVIQYVWDGVVLTFLFFWLAGLVSDLQRSEVLSLSKFLHLPVSPSGAFVVNYLSSLFSLALLLFVPAMVGLTCGLAIARGPAMLLLLPALAAEIFMVTAVTHQFQGWLASLMANKRRRRTIIVVLTMTFVLLAQLPNLVTQLSITHDPDNRAQELIHAQDELYRACTAGEITLPVYEQRLEKLRGDYVAKTEEISRQKWERVERVTSYASLFLPPAWLALGANGSAEGKIWPALLATLGMTLVGSVSLWRSYRTTLRLYTGQFTSGRRRPVAASSSKVTALGAKVAAAPVSLLLERQLPWLPEQASAVATSCIRALLRAPEVKMLLLSPLIMMVVMFPLMMKGADWSDGVRPLLGFGAMAFILLILVGLVGNQFGFDRSGFQVFMLCGARRQDILLGKNAAAAPFALGMSLAVAIVLQIVLPMRFTYFLAVPPELVSMYLLFCLLGNWLSIRAPMNIPSGGLRRAKPTTAAILLQLLFMFVLFPLAMTLVLLPLGVQSLLEWQGWLVGIPVCFLLSLAECAAILFIYHLVLTWQGDLLQAREQQIYAIVRNKEE